MNRTIQMQLQSKEKRLDQACDDLSFYLEHNVEFPDAVDKVVSKFKVSADKLRDAWDARQ